MIDPPTACACCCSNRLRKLGEDVTQTLETTPRRWKVIETVREKFSCRDCETISQTPAPFHVIPRGWAGPSLLAMIVFEKFGQHQPLNRQAERYARSRARRSRCPQWPTQWAPSARRSIPPSAWSEAPLSWRPSACMATTRPVPVLAKSKTDTGRLWIYVRDDKPFGGVGLRQPRPSIYSRDRRGEHPQAHLAGYGGILQADAYDGYNKLYLADRKPGPIREAACWVHARRPFFL